MTLNRSLAARLLDTAVEATIVGSFTTAGYRLRSATADWDDPPRMDGQHVVVTGASSGIGRATALRLLQLGATVHVTSRSADRAQAAAAELATEVADAQAHGHALDTASVESIQQFVRKVTETSSQLDVLIHNAGALSAEYATDEHGTELTVSTHLVGPYLLTTLLKPHMVSGARILWMSSGGMYTQRLDVKRIEMSEKNYRGAVAYARAKRGQVELVRHLAPQWAPDVIMHALHPGWVDTPGVDAGLPGFGKVMGPTLRTAFEGADTMVWLAATGGADVADGKVGLFWLDRAPRATSYLPGTKATEATRQELVDWLESKRLARLAS